MAMQAAEEDEKQQEEEGEEAEEDTFDYAARIPPLPSEFSEDAFSGREPSHCAPYRSSVRYGSGDPPFSFLDIPFSSFNAISHHL